MKIVWKGFRIVWHWVGKSFTFVSFSLACLIGALIGLPIMRLVVHPPARYRRVMRRCIRATFWLMMNWLRLLGLIRVKVIHPERLRQARGLIVAASHPTLIDVTLLLALIKQGNAIVRGDMWTNPITGGVVSQIYIPQFREFEAMCAGVKKSLEEGDNLIIFPEGTRSVRGKVNPLKRGAVQLALRTGHDILPVRLRVEDSTGLAKHDSYFGVPQGGAFRYTLEVLEPIAIAPWLDMEPGLAARMLTKQLAELIVGHPSLEVEHGLT